MLYDVPELRPELAGRAQAASCNVWFLLQDGWDLRPADFPAVPNISRQVCVPSMEPPEKHTDKAYIEQLGPPSNSKRPHITCFATRHSSGRVYCVCGISEKSSLFEERKSFMLKLKLKLKFGLELDVMG